MHHLGWANMFFLFNNRMGCLKSVIISVVGTIVLLLVLGLIQMPGGW